MDYKTHKKLFTCIIMIITTITISGCSSPQNPTPLTQELFLEQEEVNSLVIDASTRLACYYHDAIITTATNNLSGEALEQKVAEMKKVIFEETIKLTHNEVILTDPDTEQWQNAFAYAALDEHERTRILHALDTLLTTVCKEQWPEDITTQRFNALVSAIAFYDIQEAENEKQAPLTSALQ